MCDIYAQTAGNMMFMAGVSKQLPGLKVCSAGNVRTSTFDNLRMPRSNCCYVYF